VNSAFVGSTGSIYQWAINAGDGIIMQAGSLAIEPIELDVTFMNKKGNEMKKTKEKMLCIRVTEELMKELDVVAMQAGYKRSRFGRSILERYLSDACREKPIQKCKRCGK
jgi:hypothetical protein